jgi:hypothetical protein
MPIQRCNKGGGIGYQYGDEGTCYIYTPGDKESRERAKAKAEKQGRAIRASQARAKK